MIGLIVAVSLLAAHVTGFVEIVAAPLGAVGTIITATDKSIAGAVDIKKYIVAKRAVHKKVVK